VSTNRALIAGVSGIVGNGLASVLAPKADWEVTGIARRAPEGGGIFKTLSVDLTDQAACRASLRAVESVTHVFYCARAPHTRDVKEPIDVNLAMLRNLIEVVDVDSGSLRHVHLLQGSKYYGCENPYKTPAKESDPRVAEDNWYYAQEDYIVERSRGRPWGWSASRPHGVCSRAPSQGRNIPMILGVYAAIMKELGEPLYFPGTERSFETLYQCTGADHLAEAIEWISTTPACAGRAFNVTNGDYIRWSSLWPICAQWFGIDAGPVKTMSLAETMHDKGPVWERVVAKYGLDPTPYEKAAVWRYGDSVFMPDWDIMSDTLKLRQSGFAACVDTEKMFLDMFAYLQRKRIIP